MFSGLLLSECEHGFIHLIVYFGLDPVGVMNGDIETVGNKCLDSSSIFELLLVERERGREQIGRIEGRESSHP